MPSSGGYHSLVLNTSYYRRCNHSRKLHNNTSWITTLPQRLLQLVFSVINRVEDWWKRKFQRYIILPRELRGHWSARSLRHHCIILRVEFTSLPSNTRTLSQKNWKIQFFKRLWKGTARTSVWLQCTCSSRRIPIGFSSLWWWNKPQYKVSIY